MVKKARVPAATPRRQFPTRGKKTLEASVNPKGAPLTGWRNLPGRETILDTAPRVPVPWAEGPHNRKN
jgi:hypothetical protein